MAIAHITVTLPAARTDGTALSPSNISLVEIFRDGTSIAKLLGGAVEFDDPAVVPGVSIYTAQISDTQSPPAVSALSSPVTAPNLVVALQPPAAPSLTVTVS